jgi:O-antigen ligase
VPLGATAMSAASLNARRTAAYHWPWPAPADAGSWGRIALTICVFGGLVLLAAFWGTVVAVAGLNALYLCVSLIGCLFILRDFRIGVVLLMVLLPISRSYVFPREMLGITGLNPFNLLLAGTLGAYLLHGLFDGSIRRFMPRPLLWLYIVPILIAGALGASHVGDIAAGLYMYEVIEFHNTAGYLRDLVVKPLMMVVFALLVGAAVARSAKPEQFLVPTLISIWAMGAMVVVFIYLSGMELGRLASSDSRGVLSALGLHANDFGRLYAAAYALLLFTWAESKERWLRLALLASMGLVVVALMLTFSRGAFLGFIVVNALFLMWRVNARTVLLGGLLAAAALFALPGAVYERITTGFGSGLDAISAGRVEGIWLPLLPEIARSPIYGNGLGSIMWSEAMHSGTVMLTGHPHNAYLEALLDVGVVGLILLCAYFAHVWKGLRALSVDSALSPTLRGFYQGAAAALVSSLVAGISDSSLAPRPEHAFLWLAIGMMYGQRVWRP